jgi:hypothetical protein
MALPHESMFYEVMWRSWAQGAPYPVPWWLRQAFRRRSDAYGGGLFDSMEAALASNALYRYWNMVPSRTTARKAGRAAAAVVDQAGPVDLGGCWASIRAAEDPPDAP